MVLSLLSERHLPEQILHILFVCWWRPFASVIGPNLPTLASRGSDYSKRPPTTQPTGRNTNQKDPGALGPPDLRPTFRNLQGPVLQHPDSLEPFYFLHPYEPYICFAYLIVCLTFLLPPQFFPSEWLPYSTDGYLFKGCSTPRDTFQFDAPHILVAGSLLFLDGVPPGHIRGLDEIHFSNFYALMGLCLSSYLQVRWP